MLCRQRAAHHIPLNNNRLRAPAGRTTCPGLPMPIHNGPPMVGPRRDSVRTTLCTPPARVSRGPADGRLTVPGGRMAYQDDPPRDRRRWKPDVCGHGRGDRYNPAVAGRVGRVPGRCAAQSRPRGVFEARSAARVREVPEAAAERRAGIRYRRCRGASHRGRAEGATRCGTTPRS